MDRRIAIISLGCLAVTSALIVYPIVHEGGHFFAGKIFGAEIREVVWTPLGGSKPHVLFGQTPGNMVPWINAAGIIFPTIIGGAAMILWLNYCERWTFWWQAGVVIPTIVLLFGNLGLLSELFEPPDLLNHHMLPLAQHLGLNGSLSLVFQLAPAIISTVFLILCLRKVREIKRRLSCHAGAKDRMESND